MNTIANPWGLTPRQCQALQAFVDQGSMVAAGVALGIGESAIRDHMIEAVDKIGANNYVEAAAIYFCHRRGQPIAITPRCNPGRVADPVHARVERFFAQADDDDWLTVRDGCAKFNSVDPTVRATFRALESEKKLERFMADGKVQAWRRGPALKAQQLEAA